MDEKKQYSALTMDRAAFILLRVKRAFKKKRMQRKEREKNAQLSASTRIDQRASCAGLEGAAGRQGGRKMPPPLLRSRTLPAIVVPGVNILQAQLGNYNQDIVLDKKPSPTPSQPPQSKPNTLVSRFHSSRVSFSTSRGAGASGGNNDDGNGSKMASSTPMDRRKSAISRLCGSGSYGPDRHTDGTLLLRVPGPHTVAGNAFQRIPSPSGGSTTTSSNTNAFYRFSRLLTTQCSSKANADGFLDDGSNVPRRLSWERRDTLNARMPRSGSIDSMVEAVWAESMAAAVAAEREMAASVVPAKADSKRRSLRSGSGSSSTLGLVSPSVGRRLKGQRAVNELPTLASECNTIKDDMEVALQVAPHSSGAPVTGAGLPPPGQKPSKKLAKLMQQRLERLARINIHLHALFAAVEHGHLEKARTILESTDVDVNSVNNDGLSSLDVAVLSNNRPLVKMLVSFGGREGGQFSSAEKLGSHLKHLLGEAEMRLQELGGFLEEPCVTPLNTRASFSSMLGNAYPSSTITGCAGGDNDKQALAWGRRAKMMRRLVLGFTQARPPDPPGVLTVDVTASNAVTVRLQEPSVSTSGVNEFPITTKFKVQWSTRADFQPITGELELLDLDRPTCTVELTHGRRYYFRAACGNLKGYGTYAPCVPNSVVPSTWRDIKENLSIRFDGRLSELDALTDDIRLLRPGGCDILDAHLLLPPQQSSTANSSVSSTSTTPATAQHQTFLSAKTALQNQHLELLHHTQQHQQHGRRNKSSKKTASIKQLFTAASKFQKHLRRGIYLACILYHEDKVLLTNEDFLPVIEIDEIFPSCVHTDLHWLMKVSCTWEDAKALRAEMDKHSSSAVHFRLKLLSACVQMQQALCLQDLGQLFHRPLRDTNGTCVLSSVNYVSTPKSVSVLNSRWLPLNKVAKKCVLSEEHSVAEMLMNSIQEQIQYHQVSSLQLSKGLYVSYLKLQSSVDMIQVVVPAKTPNVLPHCKVRENPHVSAEEWSYLKQHLHTSPTSSPCPPTDQQRTFIELVSSAARRLLNYMDVTGNNNTMTTVDTFSGSGHRLYAAEVVELSATVSCIVVCPAAEKACAVPGQRELLLQRGDLLSLPIQVFEMIHLTTYQQFLVQRYSKLSCLLELDAAQASHLHREAFSNAEVAIAKERLQKLQDLQNKLNTIWRCIRWLMDAIAFSRDRSDIGIPLKSVLNFDPATMTIASPTQTRSKNPFLQLPSTTRALTNSSTTSGGSKPGGRGSWPGPSTSTTTATIGTASNTSGNSLGAGNLLNHKQLEFSKSEQHLSSIQPDRQPLDNENRSVQQCVSGNGADIVGSQQCLSACSDLESRKNSGSYTSDWVETEEELMESMIPSRSEDELHVVGAAGTMGNSGGSGGVDQASIGMELLTSTSTQSTQSTSNNASRTRAHTVCGSPASQQSISATSSPLLSARPMSMQHQYQSHTGSLLSVNTINTTNTSDSMHSLSSGESDSNGCGGAINVATPMVKTRIESLNAASTSSYSSSISSPLCKPHSYISTQVSQPFSVMAYSRSMSNVMKQPPTRPKHLNVEPFSTATPQKEQQLSTKSSPRSHMDTHLSKSMSNINKESSSGSDEQQHQRTYIKPKHVSSLASRGSDPMFKIPLLVDQRPLSALPSQHQGNKESTNTSPIALSTVASPYRASTSYSGTSGSSSSGVLSSGILQVYAAYETGLASGTSLKLHVTPRTTAREVVDLVVKQLNMAIVLKGRDGPIYAQDRLHNFCLVAVIGARERCLRDDFRPLQLQNPWRKGRLYVRQKHDVLAALEHSTKCYQDGNGEGSNGKEADGCRNTTLI